MNDQERAIAGRIIYSWELPSIMRKHIITGAMGAIYLFLLSGMYLVAFGNDLGMQYWHWGVLAAATSLAQLLQMVSAHIVGMAGNRKSIWFMAALGGRLSRGLAIVLGFFLLQWSDTAARTVFLTFLIFSSCCDAVALPPWFSWLADIIPENEHGRFMGRRSAWIAVANAVIMVPIGYAVDQVGPGFFPYALLAVFGVGFLLGILDLLIHRTIPEPSALKTPSRGMRMSVLVPLRDSKFRPWLLFNGFWTFGMTLGGSLSTLYFVENLGIRRNFFGGSLVLLLLPMVGTALTANWLGGLIDRRGVKPVLKWGHWLWTLLPMFWLFATPQNAMLVLGISSLVGGVGTTAALTAANKLLVRYPATEKVPMYVAVSTCIGALSGGVGAFFAGLFLQLLKDISWTAWGHEIVGFHIIFLMSFLLRCGASYAIKWLPEPGETG